MTLSLKLVESTRGDPEFWLTDIEYGIKGLLRPRRGVAGVNRRGFLQTLLGAVAAVAIEVLPAFGNVDSLEPDPFNSHYGCITGSGIYRDRLWVTTSTGIYYATLGPEELSPR